MKIFHFDKNGNMIRRLFPVAMTRHRAINYENTITIRLTADPPDKLDSIVTQDDTGVWREYIVQGVDTYRDTELYYEIFAEDSIFETVGDWVEDIRPTNTTAIAALNSIIGVTRWQVGTIADLGVKSTNFYRMSFWESLKNIIKVWGGELQTRVTCDGYKITGRHIDILGQVGSDKGKRFTYRKDIEEIVRSVSRDDVVTALYGFGQGEEVGDGYGRRLDFADINSGQAFVADFDALERYGRPTSAGKTHRFGSVEFDDVTDKTELLALTQAELAIRSQPAVTYEANVLDLSKYGYVHEGTDIGDTVTVIDNDLGIRLKTRILEITDYPITEKPAEIVLMNRTVRLESELAKVSGLVNNWRSRQSVWDRATAIDSDGTMPAAKITGTLENFNNLMNAGLIDGELIMHPGGFTWVNEAQNWATQISTAGIRISNQKNTNGEWIWTTIGTGEGFAAEQMFAGTLLADIAELGHLDADWIKLSSGKGLEDTLDEIETTPGPKGEDAITVHIDSVNGNIFKNASIATTLVVSVIAGQDWIQNSSALLAKYGSDARLQWSEKVFGSLVYEDLPPSDPRISDEGFIFTVSPNDILTKSTFKCDLHF